MVAPLGGVYKIAVDFIAGLIEVFMPLEERDVAGIDENNRAVDVALADAVVVGVVRHADAVDEVRLGILVSDAPERRRWAPFSSRARSSNYQRR